VKSEALTLRNAEGACRQVRRIKQLAMIVVELGASQIDFR
jgi:hypothetical protein